MIKYLKDLCKRMFKNPLRLTLKLFGLLWFFLLFQIFLKVTFNYWQPYVIPTEQLENIGNFIDSHRWLQATLNGIFYIINAVFVFFCCCQQWWFKNKKQAIIVISCIVICYLLNTFLNLHTYTTIVLTIILPLLFDYKKWLWVILTFALSNIFLMLSFILEGFTNINTENFIIGTFMQIDYYIMLGINYFAFNLIRMKREMNTNGR